MGTETPAKRPSIHTSPRANVTPVKGWPAPVGYRSANATPERNCRKTATPAIHARDPAGNHPPGKPVQRKEKAHAPTPPNRPATRRPTTRDHGPGPPGVQGAPPRRHHRPQLRLPVRRPGAVRMAALGDARPDGGRDDRRYSGAPVPEVLEPGRTPDRGNRLERRPRHPPQVRRIAGLSRLAGAGPPEAASPTPRKPWKSWPKASANH